MKNNIRTILTKVNFIIVSVILLLYFFIRIGKVFTRPNAKGDESSFLEMFNFYLENGYAATLSEGSSILFNLASSFFNLFTSNPLYALRATSLFFGIFAFIMVVKIQRIFFPLDKQYVLLAFLTSLNALIVSSIILSGINDSIVYFLAVLLVFFILKFHRDKNTIKSAIFIGLTIGAMFLTRKMSLLYLPAAFIVLLMLYHNIKLNTLAKIKSLGLISLMTILVVAVFNFPNLKEGKGISFHQKKLDKEITWIQLQYLTAMKNAKGEVANGQHVTIEETKAYIVENGKESLPKNSFISAIFFDFGFTVKQFFKNTVRQLTPITRLTGLLFLFLVLVAFLNLKKNRFKLSFPKNQYIILFSILFILTLCFIVITYIEPRWYVSVLILLPLPIYRILQEYTESQKKKELINFIFINAQLLFIIAMNVPYIFSNYKDLLQF